MGLFGYRAGYAGNHLCGRCQCCRPNQDGIRAYLKALELAGIMAIQIILGLVPAPVYRRVFRLTGVVRAFSSAACWGVALPASYLALFFPLLISIMLGHGHATTAAYAVAAFVVATLSGFNWD